MRIAFLVAVGVVLGMGTMRAGTPDVTAHASFVPFDEILANLDKYDGQRLRTVAFYSGDYPALQADMRPLELIPEWTGARSSGFAGWTPDQLIWLGWGIPQPDEARGIQPQFKNWLLVEGTFYKGPTGHWGLYAGMFHDITLMRPLMEKQSGVAPSPSTKLSVKSRWTQARPAVYVLPETPMSRLLTPRAVAVEAAR